MIHKRWRRLTAFFAALFVLGSNMPAYAAELSETAEVAFEEKYDAQQKVYGDYGTYRLQETCITTSEKSALYSDVPESSGWRYEAIKYVTENKIMNGISGTDRFEPDATMTRAMVATTIYRMEGQPNISYANVFPDVPDGNYFSKPIIWGNSKGIMRGHSNTGLFGTWEEITREDLVTILFRYAAYKGKDISARAALDQFPDAAEISGYAKEPMQWAVASGIINGRSNTGMLDPKGNATRVECAAVLQRFITGKAQNNTQYYSIMGASTVTIEQMVACYNANTGNGYPDFYEGTEALTIEDFCRIYYEEAAAEGIRVEVAFCQAMKETGWLRYGGDVGIEQFNFAGLGATGGGERGLYFDTPRIGIRAQIQHLKGYATKDPLNQECVDPRYKYVLKGCAPYVEWLGIQENPQGTGWATSPGYGTDIVKRITNLKKY